jgi:hypothetical protein
MYPCLTASKITSKDGILRDKYQTYVPTTGFCFKNEIYQNLQQPAHPNWGKLPYIFT